MLDVTMEMEQFDCPFIDTTVDHEVTFSTMHWQLDAAAEELETRMVVEGADRGALNNGISALRAHENMADYGLFTRQADTAMVRAVIEQTDAMTTIHDKGGYITGPFHIEDGSEQWQVGFDDGGADLPPLGAVLDVERPGNVAAALVDGPHGVGLLDDRPYHRGVALPREQPVVGHVLVGPQRRQPVVQRPPFCGLDDHPRLQLLGGRVELPVHRRERHLLVDGRVDEGAV